MMEFRAFTPERNASRQDVAQNNVRRHARRALSCVALRRVALRSDVNAALSCRARAPPTAVLSLETETAQKRAGSLYAT